MSIETNTASIVNSETKPTLYPERPSYSAQILLYEIAQYESGEREKEILSEEEKQNLIELETPFVDKLAEYYKLATGKKILYPEYFDTPEGQATLKAIPEFASLDGDIDIRENIPILRTLKPSIIKDLVDKSSRWNTDTMVETLFQQIDSDTGELDVQGIENPEKLTYIQYPDNLTAKIEGLEAIRQELKQKRSELYLEETSDTTQSRKALIHAKIFRVQALIKRINVLIAEAKEEETFVRSEESHIHHKPPYKLDKFIYGVTTLNPKTGNYNQVDNHLLEEADKLAELNTSINQEKAQILLEKDLDQEKLEEKNITPEMVKEYLDQILASYDLLSIHPADAEQVAKNIKPPDNKWRCYIRPGKDSLQIESKSKTLLIPPINIDVQTLITKTATHEIIHILQRENTAQIGLPLYTHSSQIAGDRAELFQEGGAMYYQDQISQELFGYESLPQPHYLRAMATKQSGGTYIDCVKTYYESILSSETETITPEKQKKFLALALDRTKRLFKNSSFNNTDKQISNTKDTVYLEQKAVVEEIQQYPQLRNLILVTGINLETAREMIQFGLLDLRNLKMPNNSAQELWEKLRPNYTLDDESQNQNPTLTPPSNLPLA
jgi:hypothetical protein